MEARGFGMDYCRLQEYHMRLVLELAENAGKTGIVWQEALDVGGLLPMDTIIHVWKWWTDAIDCTCSNCSSSAGTHVRQLQALHGRPQHNGTSDPDAAWREEMERVTAQVNEWL